MEPSLAILMVFAAVLEIVLYIVFGRFIEPRWKILPKIGFYMLITWIFASAVGWWSLIWIIGHPGLGIFAHAIWCRRHGIDWLRCEPRDKYLRLAPWCDANGLARADRL
jgi:hypothetical protein